MIEHQDHVDFSTVPVSKGLNTTTLVIVLIGVIGIFAVGGFSIKVAGFGHLWPSTHTERMNLGKMPSAQQ